MVALNNSLIEPTERGFTGDALLCAVHPGYEIVFLLNDLAHIRSEKSTDYAKQKKVDIGR